MFAEKNRRGRVVRLRLRTKLLLSLALISSGLTCATLWMVRRSVRIQLRNEIAEDLRNSVAVFGNVQRQREVGLTRSAELLANLPSLKALMTTQDAATIQDASADIWHLASSDLFVLANPTGKVLVVSTLQREQESDFANFVRDAHNFSVSGPKEIRLGGEEFLVTTVELTPSVAPFVRLSVLKSFDKAAVFLGALNRLLLVLGLIALLAGGGLVFFISGTFMRPLAGLVGGVRALEKGDFAYPVASRSGDEVAELTAAFERMRDSLQRTQQELLRAERLATIGRMASSISHDLRHPLTAVVANAEFLCEPKLGVSQRRELYREIRSAVDQLTYLVDSLLEFSQARESLRRVFGPVADAVERAIHTVRARPEFQGVNISVCREGRCETWFDHKKVERVFANMLLNACEVVPLESGKIEVKLRECESGVEIRIADNGPGVAEPIRAKLFQPFTSFGKRNGIGLGLAISQKIICDHGGSASLESTGAGKTVFKLVLPIPVSGDPVLSN